MTNYIIGGALILMALFLVISVLMQNGKDHRLSGSIAGGAETFFGKTKAKSANAILSKLTTVITIIFVILVLVLYIIQPEIDPQTLIDDAAGDTTVTDTVENEDDTVADDANADDTANGEELNVDIDLSAEGEEADAEGDAAAEGETADDAANTEAE